MQLQLRAGVATLTLDRPERRNALNAELLSALGDNLERLRTDAGVRAVVLTGAGKTFCSGLDLSELQGDLSSSVQRNLERSDAFAALIAQIYRFPKPVVAAVEGAALAGGAGLAAACDLSVLGQGAVLGYPEVRRGFVAAVVAVLLVRQVGERRAKDLLMTGRSLGAQEALAWGLANEVVEDGQVLARSQELAGQLGSSSATALAATKRLLTTLPGMGLEEGFSAASLLNAWIRQSEDLREGLRAFSEHRLPDFTKIP